MQTTITRLAAAVVACTVAALIAACKSPPQPPSVDEALKRPANTSEVVDLQRCRSDAQNSRIEADEKLRTAEAMQLAARQSLAQCTAVAIRPAPLPDLRNRIYTIRFAYASSEVSVPDAELSSLVAEAKNAVQIVLRARTDGKTDSVGEIRVAKGRAAAVKRYLAQAGVDLSRIRSTWQPSGDPVADNDTPEGRALNRRVEVEIYRTAPLVWR